MSTVVAGFPDIQVQARQTMHRHILEWFDLCDRVLDIHRDNFVFRDPPPGELAQHKIALKAIIRTCLLINAWASDPEFEDADLAARLQIRIRQLKDAYETFHDPELSDEKAEHILKQVFPE